MGVTDRAVAVRAPRTGSEPAAFDSLYRSHYPRMVVVARLTTGNLATAEEIVQDAFVQLYRRWGSVERPLGYLRIAVVHGCQSHLRRRVRERQHRAAVSVPEPGLADPDGVAVRDALQMLKPRQRAAVVLRYYEDLPEREIAEALGCRPGTVKSLLSRSLSALREVLHD